MAQFREYLEREGIEPAGEVELKLPIKRNDGFLQKGLIAPRLPKESRFAATERIMLGPDAAARVVLDLSVRVERIAGTDGVLRQDEYAGGSERWLEASQFVFLDWERLYLGALGFKEERGFHNLIIRPEHPRAIIGSHDPRLYALICEATLLNPQRGEDMRQLQAVMSAVMKKYVENFYRKRQQRWESDRMEYKPLTKDDDNFHDYVVRVPRSDPTLIAAVKKIIDEGQRIYKELCSDLPGLYLDRHLYQPLLMARRSKVRSTPPALNESESRFVEDLKAYCQSKPAALAGRELFLLRNLSRGKGIGFFEDSGFYPDFILWITQGKSQRLVFIEPHGMLNEDHHSRNPKVQLYKRLQAHVAGALKRSKFKDLTLDSFIISKTSYDDLRKRFADDSGPWKRETFAASHILFFPENGYHYLEQIVEPDSAGSELI